MTGGEDELAERLLRCESNSPDRPSAVTGDSRHPGELKIIAAILEAPVIEKILTHLGLQARAPPRAPAAGPALQAA